MSASGHEEDEDNHDGYGRAAFPINTMAAAPSGTPTTGEEYLAFVREESKQYSSILVKRLHAIDDKESKDEDKNGIFGRLPKTPKRLQPDETWMKETVKGFVKVREKIQKKRSDSEGNQKREERDWKNWAFETEERKGFEQIVEWDEVTLMNILEFVDEHVDKTGEQLKLGRCTECIYAVMAAVSLPLSRQAGSLVRSLLHKAMIYRVSFSNNVEDGFVSKLNVIITLFIDFFSQGDPVGT